MLLPSRTSKLFVDATTCVVSAVLLLTLSVTGVRAARDLGAGSAAVWGQADFNTVDHRCNHPSSMTLCGPTQAVIDDQGNLWVADLVHNRVLMFPPGSAIASKVFGQYGSTTSRGCDRPPPRGSAYPSAPNRFTLCQPAGLTIDQQGTLYVSDSLNNRILVFYDAAHKPDDAPADRVLGQQDFHASAANDRPSGGIGHHVCASPHPASACTLNSPMELSLTPHGDLLVPDLDNHRVLLWSAGSLTLLRSRACTPTCFLPASQVWGQYGSFLTASSNNHAVPTTFSPHCTAITDLTPVSACTLSTPWSAVADKQGNLYIADTANNRVLEYDDALKAGRQDATRVYGQNGSFMTSFANLGGVTASSVSHPIALARDSLGELWVTDFGDMRILAFATPGGSESPAATEVLGQQGRFTTNGCHLGPTGLCGPTGITFDAAGHAYVADGFNNRVLEFFSPPVSLARVDHLKVVRHRSATLVRWHSTGPIRGFALYLGHHRLTSHLLIPDHAGNCQHEVRRTGIRAVTLQIVLQSGQRASVAAS